MFKHLRGDKIHNDIKHKNLRTNYFENCKIRTENPYISRNKCNHYPKNQDPMTDKSLYNYIYTCNCSFHLILKGRHKKIANKRGKNKRTNLHNMHPLCSKQPYEGKDEIRYRDFCVNTKYKKQLT